MIEPQQQQREPIDELCDAIMTLVHGVPKPVHTTAKVALRAAMERFVIGMSQGCGPDQRKPKKTPS